jgi:hypothetical protein
LNAKRSPGQGDPKERKQKDITKTKFGSIATVALFHYPEEKNKMMREKKGAIGGNKKQKGVMGNGGE